jgi:preprotein translocase SecE subunit
VDKASALEAIWEVAQKKAAAAENLRTEFEARQKALIDQTDVRTLGKWISDLNTFHGKLTQKDDDLLAIQQEIDRDVALRQEEFRNERLGAQGRQSTLEDDLKKLAGWAESNRLPVVAPLLSRFQERDLNARFDPFVTRVVRKPDEFRELRDNSAFEVSDGEGGKKFAFTEGSIISKDLFDQALEAIKKKERERNPDVNIEELTARIEKAAPAVRPIKGEPVYASITLLPAIKYTVPLLLLVLAIWFAWRVVNLPTFGDFLIATEAELNKVSWTTRARLVQDTIVVLVTVILMALFLFLVDLTWAKVLSWKPIGVLQVQEKKDKPKDTELKW